MKFIRSLIYKILIYLLIFEANIQLVSIKKATEIFTETIE